MMDRPEYHEANDNCACDPKEDAKPCVTVRWDAGCSMLADDPPGSVDVPPRFEISHFPHNIPPEATWLADT